MVEDNQIDNASSMAILVHTEWQVFSAVLDIRRHSAAAGSWNEAFGVMEVQSIGLERVGIGTFPTPLETMPRLKEKLGDSCPTLYVKRDDLTGLALGGNKVRKLDFLLAEARRARADVIVTTCGIQSNWARQTTAAAIKLGMRVVLLLRTAQFKRLPRVYDGNLLLDHIMGARISFAKMGIDEDPARILERIAGNLRKSGHNPYVIHPRDVESPVATVAYVEAMKELVQQAKGTSIDWLILATAGGGTQAGLVLGAKILNTNTKVLGVNVGAFKRDAIIKTVQESCEGASKLLGLDDARLGSNDVVVIDDYFGRGYGIPTQKSLDAIRLAAQIEALILDPVYTSKAMAGLIDLVKSGHFAKDDNVYFLHTGGVPALFAYEEYFSPKRKSGAKFLKS